MTLFTQIKFQTNLKAVWYPAIFIRLFGWYTQSDVDRLEAFGVDVDFYRLALNYAVTSVASKHSRLPSVCGR